MVITLYVLSCDIRSLIFALTLRVFSGRSNKLASSLLTLMIFFLLRPSDQCMNKTPPHHRNHEPHGLRTTYNFNKNIVISIKLYKQIIKTTENESGN